MKYRIVHNPNGSGILDYYIQFKFLWFWITPVMERRYGNCFKTTEEAMAWIEDRRAKRSELKPEKVVWTE